MDIKSFLTIDGQFRPIMNISFSFPIEPLVDLKALYGIDARDEQIEIMLDELRRFIKKDGA